MRSLLPLGVLALGGCLTDPPQPPRITQPPCATPTSLGCANARNLAAMVADPTDLRVGRAYTGGDAAIEAAAVDRLRAGKARPLRNSATTNLGSGGGSAPQ